MHIIIHKDEDFIYILPPLRDKNKRDENIYKKVILSGIKAEEEVKLSNSDDYNSVICNNSTPKTVFSNFFKELNKNKLASKKYNEIVQSAENYILILYEDIFR